MGVDLRSGREVLVTSNRVSKGTHSVDLSIRRGASCVDQSCLLVCLQLDCLWRCVAFGRLCRTIVSLRSSSRRVRSGCRWGGSPGRGDGSARKEDPLSPRSRATWVRAISGRGKIWKRIAAASHYNPSGHSYTPPKSPSNIRANMLGVRCIFLVFGCHSGGSSVVEFTPLEIEFSTRWFVCGGFDNPGNWVFHSGVFHSVVRLLWVGHP